MSKELIVFNKPKSPISEAYRGLRTNIQFANVDRMTKTILVTSTLPGEGKTTTLMNLAMTMVQDHLKVLVIDCDMRKPRVHKVLDRKNGKGLADMLLAGGQAPDYIQSLAEYGFDLLTAGQIPTNPSELLNSKAMKELIASVKDQYDYVLIDTPPVTPVTDAIIMSTYIDGVVLVVTAGKANRDLILTAKQSIEKVGGNILGVVLNRIKVQDTKAYKSYYYYYGKESEAKA